MIGKYYSNYLYWIDLNKSSRKYHNGKFKIIGFFYIITNYLAHAHTFGPIGG